MENPSFDAYAPRQIAERLAALCVAKARTPLLSLAMLGVLAGAFIGLGALYSVIALADPSLGLVVVAGAELFTGNNLLAMAWAQGLPTNFAGAAGLALLVYLSGHAEAYSRTYLEIAAAKASLPFWSAFFRGVLYNILVCMAVWMTLAGRSVTDKVLAVLFPISAFVAAGFEHSVANMYFISIGLLVKSDDDFVAGLDPETAPDLSGLTWGSFFLDNLLPVTIGNVIGGALMVGAVYWLVYLRPKRTEP